MYNALWAGMDFSDYENIELFVKLKDLWKNKRNADSVSECGIIERLAIYLKDNLSRITCLTLKRNNTKMESKDILVFALVFAVLGFSLYRKYIKKDKNGKIQQKPGGPRSTGSSFSSIKDDYEPYSKK